MGRPFCNWESFPLSYIYIYLFHIILCDNLEHKVLLMGGGKCGSSTHTMGCGADMISLITSVAHAEVFGEFKPGE